MKAKEFDDVIMVGRTHPQVDATPIRLGQVISGWAAQIDFAPSTASSTQTPVRASCHRRYFAGLERSPEVSRSLPRSISGGASASSSGRPDNLCPRRLGDAHDALVLVSGALRPGPTPPRRRPRTTCWYASGPRNGIGELIISRERAGLGPSCGKVNLTVRPSLGRHPGVRQ